MSYRGDSGEGENRTLRRKPALRQVIMLLRHQDAGHSPNRVIRAPEKCACNAIHEGYEALDASKVHKR